MLLESYHQALSILLLGNNVSSNHRCTQQTVAYEWCHMILLLPINAFSFYFWLGGGGSLVLFSDIASFEELWALVGIAPSKFEKIALKMIYEDRMKGSIGDQTLAIATNNFIGSNKLGAGVSGLAYKEILVLGRSA
ncbi:hypothetical protein C5167_018490 [Papaver somniferum]|uniref:Uncharacterized protein n=1 Tax=Papaver somniferum TaxID=3469 RepID=A0A4Y7IRF1_PAPSO|nr:hypothetical protein C5167_018490 [Papaver somniferum]